MRFHLSAIVLAIGLLSLTCCSSQVTENASAPQVATDEPATSASTTGTGDVDAPNTDTAPTSSSKSPEPETTSEVTPATTSATPAVTPEDTADATPPAADPATMTTDEIVAQVQGLFREQKFDEALALLETATAKENPEPMVLQVGAQAFYIRGTQLVQEGDRARANPLQLKSAALARRFIEQVDSPPAKKFAGMVIYQEACVFALTDQGEKVIPSIQEAIELGFDDIELLKTDEDLKSLREDAAFLAFVENAAQQMVEIKRAALHEQFAAFESFDFTFELQDVEAQPVALADYQGQVVIVDFWGTWCPPCREEIPHFVALQEKYREQGLRIVGLNYNEQGTPEQITETIRTFMKTNEMNYPCAIGDDATMAQVPNLEGFPTTLFIDRAGKVRLKLVGLQPLETLESAVNLLLSEPAPEATGETPAKEAAQPPESKQQQDTP